MARCHATNASGQACGAPALRDEDYCLVHSPGRQEEVQEARRLGGIRKRRERTITEAYGFLGLGSISDIVRFLESIAIDTLAQENTVPRNRTLTQIAEIARRCRESDLEERVEALEAGRGSRGPNDAQVFDLNPEFLKDDPKEATP